MYGLAKQLFSERTGKFIDAPSFSTRKKSILCQELEPYVSLGVLSHVEIAILERLSQQYPTLSEDAAAFICHLCLAAKQGHLCVRDEGGGIYPPPSQIWAMARLENGEIQGDLGDFRKLDERIVKGMNSLPQEIVEEVDQNCPFPLKPVYRLLNHYYLQRHFVDETKLIQALKRIKDCTPTLVPDQEKVRFLITSMLENKQLLPEQAEAILLSFTHCFSLISGGPGTGKTYTAGWLIKVFLEALSEEERGTCEIALAAPTGKAASNLQMSLNKAVGNLPGLKELTAKTIHSLLGIRGRYTQGDEKTLTADIILIDESSMIDLRLMEKLFSAVKPGSRLIFLGVIDQLPPVESGSLFADLIHTFASSKTSAKASIQLKTCMRANLKTIVTCASLINSGEAKQFLQFLTSSQRGVSFHSLSLLENASDPSYLRLMKYAAERFAFYTPNDLTSPDKLLSSLSSFRLLSPLRQGLYGVDTMNAYFHRYFFISAKKNKRPLIAPIMVTANHYPLSLTNGEMGLLVSSTSGDERDRALLEEDYALFFDKEGGIRRIPALLLPSFEYAYCISIHKSQGSEFDHVLVLLPRGGEIFGREALYTGATRSRKQLEIWAHEETLIAAIEKQSLRLSGFSLRWRHLYHEPL